MENIYVLGNKVSQIKAAELNTEIGKAIKSGTKKLILNVNIHGINLANKHAWLKEFRNSAHIVFCDGQGVILGANILGKRIPERIPVTEWLWSFSSYCAKNGFSLFFLGTADHKVKKAAEKIMEKNPDAIIKGTHHGFFDKKGLENERIIELLNKAKPDVLIVSLGMPLQEKWLKDNWKKINAKVFLVGGACFDYASGDLRRGPKFLTNAGLEWLCRLFIEPRRLWYRYLVGNTIFFSQILKEKFLKCKV